MYSTPLARFSLALKAPEHQTVTILSFPRDHYGAMVLKKTESKRPNSDSLIFVQI